MNYVHQLRSYAVSVALERQGEIIAATVLDPELEECYTAERGKGAFLNGKRIQPSDCRRLEQALVAASLPAHAPRGSVEVARMVEVLHASRGLRRLGSAALNLCYLAQGRLDGYWATSVKIWDIAAGMLMVQEAGAVMTSLQGGAVDFETAWFAAAATPELHRELLALLNQRGA
jgi:myo-inositol-1(or 4)-monophosphatase